MEGVAGEIQQGRWLTALLLALLVGCGVLGVAVAWLAAKLYAARHAAPVVVPEPKGPPAPDVAALVARLDAKVDALQASVSASLTDAVKDRQALAESFEGLGVAVAGWNVAALKGHFSRKLGELKEDLKKELLDALGRKP